MTCAEARRRLPEPEARAHPGVDSHLGECEPCRAEAEALCEVDRRLQRLGAHRTLGTGELLIRLDQHLQAERDPTPPSRRWPILRLISVALLLLTLALLRWAKN